MSQPNPGSSEAIERGCRCPLHGLNRTDPIKLEDPTEEDL